MWSMTRNQAHPQFIRIRFFVLILAVLLIPSSAFASIKKALEPGLTVILNDHREIEFYACPSSDCDQQEWIDRLLANPENYGRFVQGDCLSIPLSNVTPEYQLAGITLLFPKDSHTEQGWVHKVTYVASRGEDGETLWSISKWFTGNPQNYTKIRSHNQMPSRGTLYKNNIVVIPLDLLSPAFKDLITFEAAAKRVAEAGSAESKRLNGNLELRTDSQGPYASYRLKAGDTIYSNVVMNFTDRVSPEDVLEATKLICVRSGIRDSRRLRAGDEVKIPLDLLSVMYLPPDDPRRKEYERLQKEAEGYSNPVQSEDLKGIIVILDPGHGGNDPGASGRIGQIVVSEDEIVYDIACRVKRLLETTTLAKVEMTLLDKSDEYEPKNVSFIPNDDDEYVLTTPEYRNHDAKVSANLRWYLANSIFRRATAAGASPDKVVFVSFHADSLHPEARGTMVYVPGAYLCKGSGGKDGSVYTCRQEVQEDQYVEISYKERVRSEGFSGELAEYVIESLSRAGIATHPGKPIRNQVVMRRRRYVPAVIRHNIVPTKILVEVLNLNNREDCRLATSPEFREEFATAFVAALKRYYGDR